MKAALIQTAPVSGEIDANVDALERTLAALPEADLAIFPELFLGGYRLDLAVELALSLDGHAVTAVRAAARDAACAVAVGFVEQRDGGVANSALFVDAGGEIAGVYRKTHLFDRERDAFLPGEELRPVQLAGRRLGPLLCFDVEFPEAARTLAARGADLFLTMSANMHPFREDQGLAVRARSLENGVPHLYVNRVGADGGHDFVGGSRAVDGGGRSLVHAGAGEAVLLTELPAAGPHDPRLSYAAALRPELYAAGEPPSGAVRPAASS